MWTIGENEETMTDSPANAKLLCDRTGSVCEREERRLRAEILIINWKMVKKDDKTPSSGFVCELA